MRWTAISFLMAALVGCGTERAPEPAEVSTLPAPIERVPLPDADVDGVPDAVDRCEATPTGSAVDASGCVPDADGDGVGDAHDLCADSQRGEKVDATGCRPRLQESKAFTLAVEFASGSADTLRDPRPALAEVLELLNEFPETTVVVEGHTDNRGTRADNEALSSARARALVEVLVKSGIDPSRTSASGYGESRPIQPNDTVEGRAANRRVVAIVVPAQ